MLCPILSPHLQRDIAEVEKRQNWEKKMIKGLACFLYEAMLKHLGRFILEKKRRLRGYMIKVYKIMHEVEEVGRGNF